MLFYIFVIVILIFVFYKERQAILWIPVISILVDIIPYYIFGDIDYTDKGNIILAYFRGFVFLLIVLQVILLYNKNTKTNYFGVGIYIFYIVIRQFFSIDIYSNIKLALLLSIYIALIPSAFIYFQKYSIHFIKIKTPLKMVLILYILNAVYCSIFEIGLISGYKDSIIKLGYLSILSQYGIIYVSLFLLAFYKKLNIVDYIIILISIVLVILTAKRTPVYLFIIGICVIGFFNREFIFKFFKLKYIILFALMLVCVYLSFNFASSKIRNKTLELDYTEEGRFIEYSVIINELVYYGHIRNILFGKENSFDSKLNENINKTELQVQDRNLHSDISIIVYSSGIVGLLTYLFILYSIFRQQKKYQKGIQNNEAKSAFWAIFIALCLNMFADSYTVCTARAIPYLLLGICLGVQQYEYKQLYRKTKKGDQVYLQINNFKTIPK